MKLAKNIEAKIKQEALKLFKNGRTNWDQRHTLCAVKWIKKLTKAESGNEKILIPAVYFHDTGYEKLPLGYGHKECLAAKPNHARQSARNVKEIFPKLKYFSTAEINKIANLVAGHDKHSLIRKKDLQLIFEADGFAQIDWYNCYPSYDQKNTELFLTTTFKNRTKYIKTKAGRKILKQLLIKAKKYLAEWEEK